MRTRVGVEEALVDGGELAGGGEAAAEEEGELFAVGEIYAPKPVSLESSGFADGRGGLPRGAREERDGLVAPVAAYFPGEPDESTKQLAIRFSSDRALNDINPQR